MTEQREQWIETAARAINAEISAIPWEQQGEAVQAYYERQGRAALDAVLPQIEATVRAEVLAEVQAAIADLPL